MTGEQMIIIKTKTAKKVFQKQNHYFLSYIQLCYILPIILTAAVFRELYFQKNLFTHYTISYYCLLFNSFKQSFCRHTVSRITLSNIRHPIIINFLEDIFIDFYLIASFFLLRLSIFFLCALRQYTLKHIQLRNRLFNRFQMNEELHFALAHIP